jgi:nucleotide-binding universal stress UspA family protein
MKRILVALDGSRSAPRVLQAAVELAQLANAKLVLYRAVVVMPDLPADFLKQTDDRLEDVLLRNARNDLERLSLSVPVGLVEKVDASFATPWDGICRKAIEQGVDLIVIGSHGYGGLDRILGTTAGKVANHADRNVLVVSTR